MLHTTHYCFGIARYHNWCRMHGGFKLGHFTATTDKKSWPLKSLELFWMLFRLVVLRLLRQQTPLASFDAVALLAKLFSSIFKLLYSSVIRLLITFSQKFLIYNFEILTVLGFQRLARRGQLRTALAYRQLNLLRILSRFWFLFLRKFGVYGHVQQLIFICQWKNISFVLGWIVERPSGPTFSELLSEESIHQVQFRKIYKISRHLPHLVPSSKTEATNRTVPGLTLPFFRDSQRQCLLIFVARPLQIYCSSTSFLLLWKKCCINLILSSAFEALQLTNCNAFPRFSTTDITHRSRWARSYQKVVSKDPGLPTKSCSEPH